MMARLTRGRVPAVGHLGRHPAPHRGMGQDERGVWTAPGGAKIAWFPDPDGNNLSLTQFATSE
jgi:hypothetical protein